MTDDEYIHNFTCYLCWPRSFDFAVGDDRTWRVRFSSDPEELRTWNTDIRQILADNPIRGVAADMVVLDDVQEMSAEQLPQIREILAIDYGSRYGAQNDMFSSFYGNPTQTINRQLARVTELRRLQHYQLPPQRSPVDERRRRRFFSGRP